MHADMPNFILQCNLQGCCRTFTHFLTYRNHVYSFHGATCTTGSTAFVSAAGNNGMDADEPTDSDMEMDVQDQDHSGTLMAMAL